MRFPDPKMIKLLTFDILRVSRSKTRSRMTTGILHFPAKMTLVLAQALRGIEKISYSWS